MDAVEPRFYTCAADFAIISNQNCVLFSSDPKLDFEPTSITEDFSSNCPGVPLPNCLGVLWIYHEALASRLIDLNDVHCNGLQSHGEVNWLFNVTINDISVIYVTAHRCAGGLKKLDLRSGSQRHRHFVGFFNVLVLATTRDHPFYTVIPTNRPI